MISLILFSALVGPIIVIAYVIQKLIVKCDILEKRIQHLEREASRKIYSGYTL
jgi:hypothetical protein